MKKTKVVYTFLLVITVIFGALIGGLGFLMGYAATQLDIWGATPTFTYGTNPNLNYTIDYGPLTYKGFLYDIRVELDVTMYNDSTDGDNIGNGSTSFLLTPNVHANLSLLIVLYTTGLSTVVVSEFRIRAVVILFGYDWLGIGLNIAFNVTGLTP